MMTITEEARLLASMLAKVSRGPGCWEWTGALSSGGYGRVGLPGRKTGQAHRVMFRIAFGAYPKGDTCHRCDDRRCIRPSHLFDGSRSENMRDAMGKGRLARKWPTADVERAVQLRESGVKLADASLATGIPMATISALCRARSRGLTGRAVGERMTGSKLTDDGVRLIRTAHGDGATVSNLAAKHGVSRRLIRLVVSRKRWTHVS